VKSGTFVTTFSLICAILSLITIMITPMEDHMNMQFQLAFAFLGLFFGVGIQSYDPPNYVAAVAESFFSFRCLHRRRLERDRSSCDF
jgi:hypothetical protein